MGELMDRVDDILEEGLSSETIKVNFINLIFEIERYYMKKPDWENLNKDLQSLLSDIYELGIKNAGYQTKAFKVSMILNQYGITPPEPEYCEAMKEAIKNKFVRKGNDDVSGYFHMKTQDASMSTIYRCPFCPEGKNCIENK